MAEEARVELARQLRRLFSKEVGYHYPTPPYGQSGLVVLLMGSASFFGDGMPGPGTITGSLPGSISMTIGG